MIASSSPQQRFWSAQVPVVVVGAGPAGATAARSLAALGVPVKILDRAVFPRNKPCGGGISVRALRRFPYLAGALDQIATHYVSKLYLEGPDGSSVVIESGRPAALMIRRYEFDALLVSLALGAGAELISGFDVVQARADNEGVTLTARDGRQCRSAIVIAADGVHTIVARRLRINRGWPASGIALDMMEETPRTALKDLDPSTLWVAYGYQPDLAEGQSNARQRTRWRSGTRSAGEGYAYIFPKRDHVNIGVGYLLSHYRNTIDQAPYDVQRGFIDTLRQRGFVEGESARENFTPFLIPVGGPLRRVGRGHVLVAGDAGGFVNGFTAEGIYYAMVSGDLAARAIIETGGDSSRMAGRYQRLCDDEIGCELHDSVLLREYLFRDKVRIRRVIRGARRNQRLTHLFLDLAVGARSYRSVRMRVLSQAPLLAARMMWERVKHTIL